LKFLPRGVRNLTHLADDAELVGERHASIGDRHRQRSPTR
jgi:hypothetical protein